MDNFKNDNNKRSLNVKNNNVASKKVKFNDVNSDSSPLFSPVASSSPLQCQNHGEGSDLSFERCTEDVSFELAIGDSSFVYDRNDIEDSDQVIGNVLTPKLVEESLSSLPPLASFVSHEDHEMVRRNPHLESFSYTVEPEAENEEPKAGPSGIRPTLNRQNIEDDVSDIYNFNPSERLIENEENESSFESIQSMSAESAMHESISNINFNNDSLSENSGWEDTFQNYYETQRQACYIDPFEQPLTVTRRIFGNSHYEVFENPHYVNKRFRNINVSYRIRIYPIRYEDNVPVPTAYTILNYASSAFEAVHRCARDLNLRIRPSGGVANITVIGGGLNIQKGKFEAFSDKIMLKFIERITDAMTSDTSILFKDLQIKIQFITKQAGTGPYRDDPSFARKFQHLHLSKAIYRRQEGACFFLATQHNILYKQKLSDMLAKDNKEAISGIRQRDILKDAQALASKSGCNFQLACGKDEVLQIARANNLRIVIFTIERLHDIEKIHILYNNNCPANSKQIPVTLLLHDGCYYSIVEPGFLLKNAPRGAGFCVFCLTFKNNLLSHFSECSAPCKNCFSFDCKKDDIVADPHTCTDCFVPFDNRVCFNIHKAKKLCIKRYMCSCGLFINNPHCSSKDKNQKHKCGHTLCFRCYAFVPSLTTHCCFMQVKKAKIPKNEVCVYFDIEALIEPTCTEFQAFCLIADVTCRECEERSNEECVAIPCKICQVRQWVFYHDENKEESIVLQFINKLIELEKRLGCKTQIYVASHNGARYDNLFIYKETMSNPNIILREHPLRRGCKIMTMSLGKNIIFRDSYAYLQAPLEKLPKMFGLNVDVSKTFFPYKFVTFETVDYIGELPTDKYFEFDAMSDSRKQEFIEWKRQFTDKEYDLKQQCILYCKMDVKVMRLAMSIFRKTVRTDFNIEVFEPITIASLSMLIFQTKFLKANTIPIIEDEKLRSHSYKALKWLAWMQSKIPEGEGVITTARSAGSEVKLPNTSAGFNSKPYYIDGVNPVGKVLFEFNGCRWHSCPRNDCKFKGGDTIIQGKPSKVRYLEWLEKLKALRATGYKIELIWECEYERQLEADENMREFVKEFDKTFCTETLMPRQSLFGGRTSPFKLLYKCDHDEELCYFDFASLYPSVQMEQYPVGPPIKLYGHLLPKPEDLIRDIDSYHGLIRCSVLAPANLKIPILPASINDKLIFAVCRACAIHHCDTCTHNDRHRAFTGTWTFPEMRLAIQYGYNIVKIHEIMKFERTAEIFNDYIKYFYRIKISASGWPASATDEAGKRTHLDEYARHGIILNPDEIADNPPLRNRAKLALNSLWGKLAQNTAKYTQGEMVQSFEELWKLLDDATKDITTLMCATNAAYVTYKNVEGTPSQSKNVSVIIASYVTSLGRIKLWKLLHFLGDRLLYTDTDSAIFVTKQGQTNPATGTYLGELTDEIKDAYGSTARGVNYVSTGPKSYALQVERTKTNGEKELINIIRSKGFTLKGAAKDIINFNSYEELVKEVREFFRVPTLLFKPARDGGVRLEEGFKLLRKTFDKRKVIDHVNYDTVPWGYIP